MPPTRESWHLDKKVPIGIILAILAQTAFVATWKADTDSRLVILEKTDETRASHENRLVILEQQFGFIRADLVEIKTLLRRQVPNDNQP